MNGLTYLKMIAERYNISDTCFVNFTREDIVRSGLTKEFVYAFESEMLSKNPILSMQDIKLQIKK